MLDNIRVVLARPLYAGNAGSVCRAMKNMGLRHLVIADPRQMWDERDVLQMAVNADDVWHARREVKTLEEGLADICADSDRMRQIISNLVGNALRHAAQGR